MKIFLVNHKNADDVGEWSGVPYFVTREIRQYFEEVEEYTFLEPPGLNRDTHDNGMELMLKPFGTQLTKILREKGVKADYIWFLGSNAAIPYYDYDIRTVFWHDSNWHTLLHGYLDDQKFEEFKANHYNLYLWDKKALEKIDVLVYSSDYVAEACIRNYKLPDKKVRVIPFGANISVAPSDSFLREAVDIRLSSSGINLTFIGKDWERKGLFSAGALAKRLNEEGVPTNLNIIGPHLDIDLSEYPYVKYWRFLDKGDAKQLSLFEKIMRETHFLIHPAWAEPFGIVLCEANAYGIPVLGTRVEGLMTIVRNGVNGFLFNPATFVEEALDKIKAICGDLHGAYPSLSHGAVIEYRERLNWKTGMLTLKKMLSDGL